MARNRKRRCRLRSKSGKSSPDWADLPRDVTVIILQKLESIEILMNVQWVCTQWRSICKEEPSIWRTIDMENLGHPCTRSAREDLDIMIMCRDAVDWSCGGLVDFSIKYFGSNQLLNYVTQRCTQIRRLGLLVCYDYITEEGLCEAAKRLPLLEDLEISYCDVTERALQKFGECCPLLKSLKIKSTKLNSNDNDEAMAIAKNMPSLRRLRLFGNRLTNKGVEAILNGCPHLESLDLRKCINVRTPLIEICRQRIKDFRKPNDSTSDYKFVAGNRGKVARSTNFARLDEHERDKVLITREELERLRVRVAVQTFLLYDDDLFS